MNKLTLTIRSNPEITIEIDEQNQVTVAPVTEVEEKQPKVAAKKKKSIGRKLSTPKAAPQPPLTRSCWLPLTRDEAIG
jgi:hypothetical protein